MKPAQIPQYDLDRELAKDEYFKYCCPDVEERVSAPVIQCQCGFSGRAKFILSHLSEALCPECKKWIQYKEKDNGSD